MLTILLAIALVSATGCTLTLGTSSDDDDAFPQTWDLREPPTRRHVGMGEGRETVFYEINMKDPRKVTFNLPQDVALTLPVYMVLFDGYYGDIPAAEANPTSFDARTSSVPLEETIELYRSTLKQLGMDTSNATTFENEARQAQERKEEAGPTGRTTSASSARTYDYVLFSVIAVRLTA